MMTNLLVIIEGGYYTYYDHGADDYDQDGDDDAKEGGENDVDGADDDCQ